MHWQYWDLLHPDSAEGHHKTSIIRSRKPDPVLSSCVPGLSCELWGKSQRARSWLSATWTSSRCLLTARGSWRSISTLTAPANTVASTLRMTWWWPLLQRTRGKKWVRGGHGKDSAVHQFGLAATQNTESVPCLHFILVLFIPVSCFVVVSPSQPSADKVKEVTAFSKECLEKIERSRIEKDYHEVHNTAFSFSSFPSLLLSSTVSASPLSFSPALCLSSLRSSSCVMSVWRNRRTSWPTLTCISCVCSALPARCFPTCSASLMLQTTPTGWWRDTCEFWRDSVTPPHNNDYIWDAWYPAWEYTRSVYNQYKYKCPIY